MQNLLLAFFLAVGLTNLPARGLAQATTTPETPAATSQPDDQPRPVKKKRPNPVMSPVKDVDGLPRVLLIGDSISIGYTLQVRKALEGKANVHRPLTNCGPTTKGLEAIDRWLGDKPWDVIHFNFGLHDLKYMGPDGKNLQDPQDPKNQQQVPPEQYAANLRKLVERLKQTNAKLIWRSTTPVPANSKGRVQGDASRYNAIATQIMEENEVEIHDMHKSVQPRMSKLMQPKGNVHFTPAGSQILANEVVDVILKAMGS